MIFVDIFTFFISQLFFIALLYNFKVEVIFPIFSNSTTNRNIVRWAARIFSRNLMVLSPYIDIFGLPYIDFTIDFVGNLIDIANFIFRHFTHLIQKK